MDSLIRLQPGHVHLDILIIAFYHSQLVVQRSRAKAVWIMSWRKGIQIVFSVGLVVGLVGNTNLVFPFVFSVWIGGWEGILFPDHMSDTCHIHHFSIFISTYRFFFFNLFQSNGQKTMRNVIVSYGNSLYCMVFTRKVPA